MTYGETPRNAKGDPFMSTRTNLRPQVVLDAGDMSGDLVTDPTILQSLSCGSYALTWTGSTPVGSVSLQISDDYKLNPNGTVENAGTWNTAPISVGGTTVNSAPVSGNTGTGYIEILGTGGYAIRLIYTSVSGSGSLTVTVNGKVT